MALTNLKPRVKTIGNRIAKIVEPGSWRNGKETAYARGYDARWRRRREQQLRAEPLCAYCLRSGRAVEATVADHITPHRGDPALFEGPLQSLCASCHSSAKAKEERDARNGLDPTLPSGSRILKKG